MTGSSDGGFTFIVGLRKSGSTWLLNLMSLHPDIRGLMETNLFHIAWAEPDPVRRTERLFTQSPWSEGGAKGVWKHHLMRLGAPLLKNVKPALSLPKEDRPAVLADVGLLDRIALRRELRGIADPGAYVQRFFEFQRQLLRPRRYLLEKSPGNVHRMEKIWRVFPGSKMVVIYRDGRDVVTSDKFFTRDYGHQDFDFAKATRAWVNDMEAHLKDAGRYPLFACAYERLLEDGAAVARELFQFLDLPHDEDLVQRVLERSSFRFYAGRDRGQEDRKRFYRKGVAGDWKNHFGVEEKRIFKEAGGEMLIRLGYERDLSW